MNYSEYLRRVTICTKLGGTNEDYHKEGIPGFGRKAGLPGVVYAYPMTARMFKRKQERMRLAEKRRKDKKK